MIYGHYRQTDRQTDGRTDGQTDKQTDRLTDRILIARPRLHFMPVQVLNFVVKM